VIFTVFMVFLILGLNFIAKTIVCKQITCEMLDIT